MYYCYLTIISENEVYLASYTQTSNVNKKSCPSMPEWHLPVLRSRRSPLPKSAIKKTLDSKTGFTPKTGYFCRTKSRCLTKYLHKVHVVRLHVGFQ